MSAFPRFTKHVTSALKALSHSLTSSRALSLSLITTTTFFVNGCASTSSPTQRAEEEQLATQRTNQITNIGDNMLKVAEAGQCDLAGKIRGTLIDRVESENDQFYAKIARSGTQASNDQLKEMGQLSLLTSQAYGQTYFLEEHCPSLAPRLSNEEERILKALRDEAISLARTGQSETDKCEEAENITLGMDKQKADIPRWLAKNGQKGTRVTHSTYYQLIEQATGAVRTLCGEQTGEAALAKRFMDGPNARKKIRTLLPPTQNNR